MKKKMKIIVIGLLVVAVGIGVYMYMNRNVSVGIDQSIVNEDGKAGTTHLDSQKVLVVYFSHGGNTQKLAKEIYNQVGGDLRRIETVEAYPDDSELYDYTKQEQDENQRPKLKDLDIDISKYDTVFLGYPIWWYTYPQAILSFFDTYDLTGKTIVPFVTHGGSGMSGTEEAMKSYLKNKNVIVLQGLAVNRNQIEQDQKENVNQWLKELGFID